MKKTMFDYDLLKTEDFEIVKDSVKKVYNTDGLRTLKEYAKSSVSGTVDAPQLSSALNVKNKGYGKILPNSFGYLLSTANNIGKSMEDVALFSSACSVGHGFSVNKDNFIESMILFSVRRIVSANWTNEKDEYLAPNENHQQFEQFKYDSLVYSLFESKSNQSSLRQVEYKNHMWDIKNEFFWISSEQMKEFSDKKGYDELYNDARTSTDRHVYKLLFGPDNIYNKLSPDAKLVLDKATELVEKSMELRQAMANDENHLDSWDAGYAQLKLVWKQYFQEDFKEFRQLYKNLEDRMRPLVYELGFLIK
jgi:transcription termination factor Rho